MIRKLLLPQLSMGMSEGTIVEWLAREGDDVPPAAPLLNLETEKVVSELPTPYAGILHIDVPAGQTIAVDTLIARFAGTRQEYASLIGAAATTSGAQTASLAQQSAEPDTSLGSSVTAAPALGTKGTERVVASGLARKLAGEHEVSLRGLSGTGPNGRIIRRDVLEAAQARAKAPMAALTVKSAERTASRKIRLEGMRGTVARRMVESGLTAAPASFFFEVDASALISMRNDFLTREAELGTRISMISIYARALALALKAVPICNATLIDNVISVWDDVDIGIAVALPGQNEIDSGLIVPVVRGVNEKGILALDREIKDLVSRARARQLMANETDSATVTLSSTDGFFRGGWMISAPLLSLPQVVSVQPGSIVRKPVVHQDQVVIRDILPCGLTFDHRALDGEPATKLAARFADFLSSPALMLL